jgi:hypothetical protein
MKYATRMLAIAVTMLPLLATAQLSRDTKLDTQVPFQFLVGNKLIPAGECIVQSIGVGESLVAIHGTETKFSLFSMVTNAERQSGKNVNALIFHRYGNVYFLSGMKLASTGQTYEFPQGKVETELRAQNVQATEEVLLAELK